MFRRQWLFSCVRICRRNTRTHSSFIKMFHYYENSMSILTEGAQRKASKRICAIDKLWWISKCNGIPWRTKGTCKLNGLAILFTSIHSTRTPRIVTMLSGYYFRSVRRVICMSCVCTPSCRLISLSPLLHSIWINSTSYQLFIFYSNPQHLRREVTTRRCVLITSECVDLA